MLNVPELYIGECLFKHSSNDVAGGYEDINAEQYYCIENYDALNPFFINLVSSSDHWFFVSSSGGLSAGRKNAECALFPYYTVDKITENAANTGHISVLQVTKGKKTYVWEPLAAVKKDVYKLQRNIYKNVYGNKLIFEEFNLDLGLKYQYMWQTSDKFGFIKSIKLKNIAGDEMTVSLVDGLQNLLPYGATTALQSAFSNLLDGYKRNELHPATGLGIFTLSSTLTDLAEPSESLKATTAWQAGLPRPLYLLSTDQVQGFLNGRGIEQETDIRGRRGAYLVHDVVNLDANADISWRIVVDVHQDHSAIISLINSLQINRSELEKKLDLDIERSTAELVNLIASADGLQLTGDDLCSTHHCANVLFNIMRGGTFIDNHSVHKDDLKHFIQERNSQCVDKHRAFFKKLPQAIHIVDLLNKVNESGDANLVRLSLEYLPLTFSRRHGDPSRPWNQFSINIKNRDGSRRLDYQGNWRDIFQNWEPLAYSYPGFVESMIGKLLNATTMDGYNPYRITRDGIEWEVPAPEDPWANIGYWSDHQIIYLQKLLEISAKVHPGKLQHLLSAKVFSFANVPYRIKDYASLIENWYDTIEFDSDLNAQITKLVSEIGADGKLVLDSEGQVFHVNLAEKLINLLLAKLANFVPSGGIWMNTQRPEWNDANNALVGKGLSVVTLCYLRRYIAFIKNLLSGTQDETLELTTEVTHFLDAIWTSLRDHEVSQQRPIDDKNRRAFMDALGTAGSAYRLNLYHNGFSGEFTKMGVASIIEFLNLTQQLVEDTIKHNQRSDGLYHAYNVLNSSADGASIRHLYEMLEGQVAVLSSGLLSGEQSVQLLKALKASRMYRADQHSYMLYPDRDLPGFLEKNSFSANDASDSLLITRLVADGNPSLVLRDENNQYHFNGDFKNARDLEHVLADLEQDDRYRRLVTAEKDSILALFENVFDHNAFTGRSGTFFAYEGLGSIYWHMVSKLLLAAQEAYFSAFTRGDSEDIVRSLAEAYYDIRQGIGFNKTPEVYGAFPTDPYSHTPAGRGAKQPGMTGQVKEECVSRIGELGVDIHQGIIAFHPVLLRRREFLAEHRDFDIIDLSGHKHVIPLRPDSLAFTFCQVPVIYVLADSSCITIDYRDAAAVTINGSVLDAETSRHILMRDGYVRQLTVYVTDLLD